MTINGRLGARHAVDVFVSVVARLKLGVKSLRGSTKNDGSYVIIFGSTCARSTTIVFGILKNCVGHTLPRIRTRASPNARVS